MLFCGWLTNLMSITLEVVFNQGFLNFILLLYGRVKPFSACSDFYSQYFHRYPRHENLKNRSPFLF